MPVDLLSHSDFSAFNTRSNAVRLAAHCPKAQFNNTLIATINIGPMVAVNTTVSVLLHLRCYKYQ